jgi:hypothetical protein
MSKRKIFVFLLLSAATLMAQSSNVTEKPFVSGGSLRLRLEAGEYVIQPSDAEKIVVTVSADSEELERRTKVDIAANGSFGTVTVRRTPNGHHFRVVIEVPRRTDLHVRMTAGELHVQPVEGSKDVELRAGELIIEVPNPEQYGHRDASVWAGSVEAAAFDVSKGGLFRSFDQQGPGRYRLHAHVLSGEIQLQR